MWDREDHESITAELDKTQSKPAKRAVPSFMAKKELENSQRRESRDPPKR